MSFDPSAEPLPLALGCMYFGSRLPRAEAFALLDRFADAGGTLLDTADCYAFWEPGCGGGESESCIGEWLGSRGKRQAARVCTKVGAMPGPDGVREGLSGVTVSRAVEGSLRRLGVERIDLCYAHVDDREVPLQETLSAFARLIEEGKLRAVACSNTSAGRIREALALSAREALPAWCAVQQMYTYLQPLPGTVFLGGAQLFADAGLLQLCRETEGLRLLAYSPLLGGAYDREDKPIPEPFLHPANQQRLQLLQQLARERDCRPGQLVLAWMIHRSPSVIPVAGASTSGQLEANLAAARMTLSPEEMRRLDAISGP